MLKKWNKTKILMTAVAATGSILGSPVAIYAQESDIVVYTGDEKNSQQSNIVAPQIHTKQEILNYYISHLYDIKKEVTYEIKPSFSPYTAGKLSKETVTDGLNALNFMRYIAGIPADVTINEEYETMAQTGSVVMARNNKLSHEQEQANDIPQDFFKKGLEGTSHSNIGTGYINISASIISGYMNDGDKGNIDRVGHRRWILNPAMKETGFGYCNISDSKFTALYALDSKRENYTVDYVAWPAENMPLEVLDGPWTISLSKEKFQVDDKNISEIKVIMTDLKSKQIYQFDNTTNHTAGEKPYFNVDTGGYGMGSAIIFSPSTKILADDQIRIQVTGLKDNNGKEATIDYTVNFFSLQEATRETAKAPQANLAEATYRSNQKVSLTTDTKGATIYYTTDGSTPTTSSTQYTSSGIQLTGVSGLRNTIVVKAIAVKDGMNQSAVSSFTYKIEIPAQSYSLTVKNGKGSGKHEERSTVTITANVPEVGKQFKGWIVESGDVTLADSSSATTTFVMPSGNVTVQAEYQDAVIDPSAPTHTVTVRNGSGTGTYAVGTVVEITAEKAASGMQFDHWNVVSGSAVLADSNKKSTRFVMTDEIVTVEAEYKRESSVSNGSGGGSKPSSSSGGVSYGPGATQISSAAILNSSAGKQYLKSNGAVAVNEWVKDQNTWYYAGADGILKTGWLKTDAGKWYYLAGDCAMATGWRMVDGKWYYLDTVNGDMKSGWQLVNGKWYYLDPTNGDMKSAWQLVNGKWYYMDPADGDMKSDWQLVNGKWYYLDPVNGDMKTGWQLVRGKWYYMDSENGDCLINTVTPDGYRVDENGAWVH